MRNKRIEHCGIVKEINLQGVLVQIERTVSCASCHAKDACSISDVENKTILLPHPSFQLFTVGEKVNVIMRKSQGFRAVFLAYVVPLILLVGCLLILFSLQLSDLIIGILALGIVALYYFALYFFRHQLSKEFTFAIEKLA
ncbi:MAG: SoxR reducing system RseC family protein [Bacteroidales bacterium]